MDYFKQIYKLKQKGLEHVDDFYLRNFLKEVSILRIYRYLSLFYKKNINKLVYGITMEKLFNIYKFDCSLRNIINSIIDYVEIALKSQFINNFENKNSESNYIDENYFINSVYYKEMIEIFHMNQKRNKSNNLGNFYSAIEYASIGVISRLYSNLKKEYKNKISKNDFYDINSKYFANYLCVLTELRNKCCHRWVLYGISFKNVPRLSLEEFRVLNINNKSSLFVYIFILIKLVPNINLKRKFINNIDVIIKKYKRYIDMNIIDFPNNWELLLLKSS